jgi:hypothetical protein
LWTIVGAARAAPDWIRNAINGEPELNAARLAAEDRPLSISEALSMNRQAHPSGPPTPTHPVRPVKEA